ncbi:MAG: preprotein translocase subunit SecG [Balneolales bacterium]|nr:preprotein translocase subunit SecG [Balneolales bacterium]
MLYTLTIILIAIICLVLIIVVLLQSGQGGGLSGGMAGNVGGGAGNMVGARRTADFLSRTTSILGGVFLVLCVLANFLIDSGTDERSVIQRSTGFEQPAVPNLDDLQRESAPAIPQQQQSPVSPEPSNDDSE